MARDLLGRVLHVRRGEAELAATIVETEAYLGAGDPASHSHRGPTRRASIMFGKPGIAYVYFIYGMYHCLNAVTELEGRGAAVLIRALSPSVPDGFRGTGLPARQLAGPGRLCRALGIDLRMNGWDLTSSALRVLAAPPSPGSEVMVGPRVGLTRAVDLPLRFRLLEARGQVPRVPR